MNNIATQARRAPKLRFPGFNDAWQTKNLGEIADIKTGPFGSLLHEGDYVGQGTPIITVENLANGVVSLLKNTPQVSKNDRNRLKNYLLRSGDIVFSRVGSVDRSAYVTAQSDGWLFSGRLLRVRPTISAKYLNSYLQRGKTQNSIRNLAVGGTMPSLNTELLGFALITYPDPDEQKKIAIFFELVDQKIAGLQKRMELLRKYKQATMQALFVQKVRFKDRDKKDYPPWQEKKLGEVGDVVTGKTPATKDRALWGGDILFVTPTDIQGGAKYQQATARTVNSIARDKLLPAKSILYTCIASIGKMSLSVKPSITNQQINSLIPYEEYENEFIYYALLWATPRIKATQANTTLPIINKTEFSQVKLSIPAQREQKKIADFLAVVDDKISLTGRVLGQAEKFKKTLLQEMFV